MTKAHPQGSVMSGAKLAYLNPSAKPVNVSSRLAEEGLLANKDLAGASG